MSHFYGTLSGARGPTSRTGTKGSGIVSNAAGWGGSIRTVVWHDQDLDLDLYEVWLTPWENSGGVSRLIERGELDATAAMNHDPEGAER